jgi:hypothetical protein
MSGVYDQAGSSQRIRAITASNTTLLDPPADALHVTVAGDVHITDPTGYDTVVSVAAGIWPQACIRVWATDTTATVSHAYYKHR